ncbi:hypothetical protein IGI04_029626 [Brassica rapa subsp. trilocularis]|uniref:Uncharacterized protein n=1 Tax=Brassica rapa subsp. trilocularis TaxID=1813537 RepID=A0ABQ7LQ23_BRACM|nr:hypothetical protein IGI04_029626 [Brassica rapa subsp. trilocularis]
MSKLGNTLLSRLVIYLLVLPLLVSAAAEEENDFSCSVPVNSATTLNLVTGSICLIAPFLHILPDAIESLTSSCLGDEPAWGDFPMVGVVSMSAMILTMIESFASSYMKRLKSIAFENKEEENKKGDLIHVHNQRQHDHNNIRRKLLTHVLESGIVIHLIIVGIALGASSSVSTIKPFIGAITIRQLLEGVRLGRCIRLFKRCSCRNIILHGDF